MRLIYEYKLCAQNLGPKVGMRLIHEGGLYSSKYGNLKSRAEFIKYVRLVEDAKIRIHRMNISFSIAFPLNNVLDG